MPPALTPAPWWPDVDDVAAILRARTRRVASRAGGYADTFLDPDPDADPVELGTRPTAAQVLEVIEAAVSELYAATGGIDPCTDGLRRSAWSFARYRAAQLVEISYYPEISDGDTSAADALGRIADRLLDRLSAHILDRCGSQIDPEDPGTARGASPAGIGPCVPIIGRHTRW